MTEKKIDKGATFGDESVSNDPENIPTGVPEIISPELQKKAEDHAKEVKALPQVDESYPKWEDHEASVREELSGYIVGRRLEEALRYVKKGFELAGGK